MNIQTVANRLKTRRAELKLSTERVAALCGVKAEKIISWEEGRSNIPAYRLYCLAKALSTSANWLVGLED